MTADSNASANPPVDAEAEAIARRDSYKLRAGRLGALAIAFFVISAAAPLTGMAGGAPFAMLLGNGSGVPTSYLLVTLLMLVFAVGYVAMSRHHTSSGAFYAYIGCAALIGATTPAGKTLEDDVAVAKYLLDEGHVAAVPGTAYGLSPFFRISTATSDEVLAEAVKRIAAAVAKLEF